MPQPARDEEYEDLLGLWADLEAALAVLLARPRQVRSFPAKLRQLDQWLQDLVAHDIDAALYLMFQLAGLSSVGYSSSHALVCATLCHIMAPRFELQGPERTALVRAAFTMNIAMTAMQDELAGQREPPSAAQQEAIRQHPRQSEALLEQLHITDDLWLEVVGQHHAAMQLSEPLAQLAAPDRLTRILGTIDRYAAMISPRKSRPGRSATASVRALMEQEAAQSDEVGFMLVRTVGLCPPGTFVRLDNGDTAIVLRRGARASAPLVASLLDASGALLQAPALHDTAQGRVRVQSALARSDVTVELNHRVMVRLGLYAARQHRSSGGSATSQSGLLLP